MDQILSCTQYYTVNDGKEHSDSDTKTDEDKNAGSASGVLTVEEKTGPNKEAMFFFLLFLSEVDK